MQALCNIHTPKSLLHLSQSHPCQFFSKPLLPSSPFPKAPSSSSKTTIMVSFHHDLSPKPLPSLHKPPNDFFNSQTPSHSLKPLYSLVKSITLSIATVALLLSRFPTKPSFAMDTAPPSTANSASLPADAAEEEEEMEKERTFLEYLESHPDDENALKALMGTQMKLGKLSEAIDTVDRLILLQPTRKEWSLLRAHLHLHCGDPETAKSAFEDIIAGNPFDIEAYHGLAMATAQSEPGGLNALMERIEDVMDNCRRVKKKQELRDFRLLMAQVNVVVGKYDDALKLYQELVKEEPRDFRPYLCQGILYTLMGKEEDAVKQFRKYRRLAPRGHPYTRYFNEDALVRKGFSPTAGKEKVELNR